MSAVVLSGGKVLGGSSGIFNVGQGGGGATPVFNYPSGFASAGSDIVIAWEAALNGSTIALTPNNNSHQSGVAWYNTQQSVTSGFTTQFTFQVTPTPSTPGLFSMAFVVQNSNSTSNPDSAYGGTQHYGTQADGDANVGGYGSYNPSIGANQIPIGNSVAICLNGSGLNGQLNYPSGSYPNATGVYIFGGGYAGNNQAQDLNPYGINLASGHVFSATIVYDGSILTLVIEDTSTFAQARFQWPVNIADAINIAGSSGATTAWVGFSGGTPPGGEYQQGILTWAYWTGYNTRLATPAFSLASGEYTGTQSVSISYPVGANCYYTTNGLMPTSASTLYTGPISVAANTVLQAVAIESGFTDSYVAMVSYQINTANVINFPSGFAANDGVILVGTSVFSSSAIQFVNTSQANAVGAAWWGAPVNIESGFSTTFQLQFTSAQANGLAFVIQNQGTATPLFNSSTGGSCVSGGPFTFANSDSALGYGYSTGGTGTGTTCGIGTSIAIAFDLYNVANSVGYYTNGALPEGNQTSITGGLSLASGHPINVTISYSGTTLTAALTDTVNSDTFSTNWTGVNIPSIVGANTAYIGFTAATGGEFANMFLNNWTAN